MALRFVRTADRVTLVNTADPDVTLPSGVWRQGWVLEDTPGVSADKGACRAKVRPLDAVEVVACQSKRTRDEGSAVEDYCLERIEAARLGCLGVDGLPDGASLTQPDLVLLGSAIMEWSLGIDGPFGLEAVRPPDAASSSDSGSGPPSSEATAPEPDASKGVQPQQESTAS